MDISNPCRLPRFQKESSFDVPERTTTNVQERKPGKYVISFAPELIEFIETSKKLTTYRYGDKYDYLKVGDIVVYENSATRESIGKLRIINKSQSTLGGLPLDNPTHEAYKNKEHQRKVLSGYYAYLGRELQNDDPFLIFDFELVY